MNKYKYYIIGDSVPVRVTVDEEGYGITAEVPSETKRSLITNDWYRSRVLFSDESEPASESKFNSKVNEVYKKRNLL